MIIGIISPYSGDIEANKAYLRRIMAALLADGHSPVAGHAMYPGILDDSDPEQRKRGMVAGQQLLLQADQVRIYIDRGISAGMLEDIEAVTDTGKIVEMWSILIPNYGRRTELELDD